MLSRSTWKTTFKAPDLKRTLPAISGADTHRILDLLACHHVNATFFVLDWVADRFPQP